MLDPDRVASKFEELGGSALASVGDATGNSVEGRFREAEGEVGHV